MFSSPGSVDNTSQEMAEIPSLKVGSPPKKMSPFESRRQREEAEALQPAAVSSGEVVEAGERDTVAVII